MDHLPVRQELRDDTFDVFVILSSFAVVERVEILIHVDGMSCGGLDHWLEREHRGHGVRGVMDRAHLGVGCVRPFLLCRITVPERLILVEHLRLVDDNRQSLHLFG